MTDWEQLGAALDDAIGHGQTLQFWWRDDDAGKGSPALTRLLELAERLNLPLALAVVPTWLESDVQGQIAAHAECTVLQHGYAHANHAPSDAKSIEIGGRALDSVAEELLKGFSLLEDAFGASFLPVLVPPWNRIEDAFHKELHALGFSGLSVFGERVQPEIVPGVALVNTHIDPVDWRGTRGFLGDDVVLQQVVDQLDLDEPIGILSHHLAMDEACWAFLEHLLSTLANHPAVRICAPPYIFSPPSLTISDTP